MMSDNKDLAVTNISKELTPERIDEIVDEITSLQIFQYPWEDLLQVAPTAIFSIGACLVAASSKSAVVIFDEALTSKFQYMRFSSLSANLVELGNLGRLAFIEAETSMGAIQQASKIINHKLIDIIPILDDLISARSILKPQLLSIQKAAEICRNRAAALDAEFDKWLRYALELHSASEQQLQSTTAGLFNTQIAEAVEQTRLKGTEDTVNTAQIWTDYFGDQVKKASEAFERASKNFPSGWDYVGQQLVSELGSSVASAFNTVVPMLAQSYLGGPIPSSGAPANGTNAQTQVPVSAIPKQAADPAYSEILRDLPHLRMLNIILFGNDGVIDWNRAKLGGDNGRLSGIKFISLMLEKTKADFESVASSDEPSVTMQAILDESSLIAKAISDTIINQSTALPLQDSPEVKEWQSKFDKIYSEATKLEATAKSFQGSIAGSISAASQDDTEGQSDANSVGSMSYLEAVSNNLRISSQVLINSQDALVKKSSELIEQKNRLTEIQAELARLGQSKALAEQVIEILKQALTLMVKLKDSITKLNLFFASLATSISICIDLQVKPFLESIKNTATGESDLESKWTIGSYTLTDLLRMHLYETAITIRCYFGVFGDIAQMWSTLSINHIMPGLKMCDELSLSSQGEVEVNKKATQLHEWCDKASKAIAEISAQKHQEILLDFDERVKKIEATTSQLKAPPAAILQAITDGTDVSRKSAMNLLDMKSATSPLSRWA